MTMEQKQQQLQEQNLNEELSFTDKEKDCIDCEQEKEVVLSFGLSTRQEWDNVMVLIKKYGLNREEMNYVYGFYNRELKQKKSPGCGKCFYNICKNLEKRYKTLLSENNL